ncbi:MAG: 3-phosphoshikimate 1-carboxyvinyltransferase [Peptoniphilaceae bacterium]|nr:3-phosphoshikimate 1-carboxyvinyltransferase [Peptoniphilaceae bacterium]MDY6085889.1 3-phosphoshikimate 1-carboxyvinyltransferase [Peptoniphilaceae bacterium]
MRVTIRPSIARGRVTAPPSKSMAHRLTIGAGLAAGESAIRPIVFSDDIDATLNALSAFGADVERRKDGVRLMGLDPRHSAVQSPIDCHESGSTLRFFIPLALLSDQDVTFTGAARLMQRPQTVYEALAEEKGFVFERGADRIHVRGPLRPGVYRIPGDVSSQFATGLLYTLPLLNGESRLIVEEPVESRPYLALTLDALSQLNIDIDTVAPYTYRIPGNQIYRAGAFTVEGDYSNAAPFLAFNFLGGHVAVVGLTEPTLQGDARAEAHMRAIVKGTPEISLRDCPDLGPLLFALAGLFHGATFTDAARLRDKESDRVGAMAQELEKCGIRIEAREGRVCVEGGHAHAPVEELDGHNDHRIVMALCVVLSKLGGTINGAQAVRKSFPNFFEQLRFIGIDAHLYDDGKQESL